MEMQEYLEYWKPISKYMNTIICEFDLIQETPIYVSQEEFDNALAWLSYVGGECSNPYFTLKEHNDVELHKIRQKNDYNQYHPPILIKVI